MFDVKLRNRKGLRMKGNLERLASLFGTSRNTKRFKREKKKKIEDNIRKLN